jgi:HD-GYP domain-containing protein (c-di-GMP phosphodiesterase class II)
MPEQHENRSRDYDRRLQTRPLPPMDELNTLVRLTRLYDIVRSLNSIIQLDKLLNQIVASAAEMMEARGGALMLVDSEGKNLTFEVASGGASAQLKGLVIPITERSVAGMVALRGTPYIENDTENSPYFSGQVDKQTGYQTRKLICVPLMVQDRIIGVVEVLDKVSGGDFNTSDLKLLEAMADAAAVAIENVRLYEEERKKARLLTQAYDELSRTYRATLQALTGLLDTRDAATQGHSNRVVAFTLRLAKAMGITNPERLKAIEQGALLHDVGKIGVADSILRKPGPLDETEWEEMRGHPELGYRMLKDIQFLQDALPIVRYHHEHWNGAGYPLGLEGETIPVEARIFAVIDAFDAITSERPYSPPRTYEQAVEILTAESGIRFDPKVVKAFLTVPKEDWDVIRSGVHEH